MHTQNPEPEKLALPMDKVQLYALPFMLPGLLMLVPYVLLYGAAPLTAKGAFWPWYGILAVFIGGIVVHELIHATAWKLTSGLPWSAFRFGVQWKTATPYAHAAAPMPVWAYRIGAAAPLVALGLLPYPYALLTGSAGMLLFSLLFTVVAAGDLMILWLIRKLPRTQLVQDHPTEAGVWVYEDQPSGQVS